MPNYSGKKTWRLNHGLSSFFFINDPSKIGCFHQHWENFAETLQFEDIAVNIFFIFYYLHIFVILF